MATTRLVHVARSGALALLETGEKHKRWSPGEKAQWTRAFNALQRLAGKKLVLEGGRMVKDRAETRARY